MPLSQQGEQGGVSEGIRLQQPDPLALDAIQRKPLALGQGRDIQIQVEREDRPLAEFGFEADLAPICCTSFWVMTSPSPVPP